MATEKTSKKAPAKKSPSKKAPAKKAPAKKAPAKKAPAKKTSASKTASKKKPLVDATRHIGLSLGADICWPTCFEQILDRLDVEIPYEGERVRLAVERVTMEPYDLRQPTKYDIVLDRLSHWLPTTREWLKKAVIMDDVYVWNNPWSIQAMEKHSTYAAMMHLGLPVPETWMIPPKSYEPHPDLRTTLQSYAKLFDLSAVGEEIGYPLFIKPYDGGGWRGVSLIKNAAELRRRYEESGTQIMHLQKAILPFDSFVRCIGIGPQTHLVSYDPDAPLHDRYTMKRDFLPPEEVSILEDMTLTINAFFAFEFNSCEALRSQGTWHPIDFANACPDAQVTSLHYHFPAMVKAILKWSIYCAVTKRPMQRTLDWKPFFDIAATDGLDSRERLRRYAQVARERLDAEPFQRFCEEHLGDLDQILWEYFGTSEAKETFRRTVAALYPQHEIDLFTNLFFQRVQAWREDHPPTSGTAGARASLEEEAAV
jgi:hypothetical protein